MPISDTNISYIDPNSILIGDRQRSETTTAELKDSITKYGILNPIIVTDNTGEIHLVAGRRRLACAIELGMNSVPIRFYETPDPVELKIVELEENIKRSELPWRDRVRAIGELDDLKTATNPNWTDAKTGALIGYSQAATSRNLVAYRNLDNPAIAAADTLTHALGILDRISERRTAAIVEDLLRAPSGFDTAPGLVKPEPKDDWQCFSPTGCEHPGICLNTCRYRSEPTQSESGPTQSEPEPTQLEPVPVRPEPVSARPNPIDPILVGDFRIWAESYSGPKFNLIHCDFPYGVHAADATLEHYENTKKLFDELTDCLTSNLDRILSYSAHIMFWLNFEYYEEIKLKLRKVGLQVINRPLIWAKSDFKGAAPGAKGTMPRHSYESALLAHRGGRPLVKQGADSYAAPTVSNPIHATQKPEPMLRYFLSMLIDNVTDFLDPTAGSGAAIRAAESLGARSVLGIEIDPDYARAANATTLRARTKQETPGL